jgi:hypothetical protein
MPSSLREESEWLDAETFGGGSPERVAGPRSASLDEARTDITKSVCRHTPSATPGNTYLDRPPHHRRPARPGPLLSGAPWPFSARTSPPIHTAGKVHCAASFLPGVVSVFFRYSLVEMAGVRDKVLTAEKRGEKACNQSKHICCPFWFVSDGPFFPCSGETDHLSGCGKPPSPIPSAIPGSTCILT